MLIGGRLLTELTSIPDLLSDLRVHPASYWVFPTYPGTGQVGKRRAKRTPCPMASRWYRKGLYTSFAEAVPCNSYHDKLRS